ncbi:MAG: enoyl-CoA hydratase/isomerase family protein, partial [Candidatus Omnitrophica bacterium]|nr:enoyl-CoA hydratase/isomerase family protein [Candidatus Omnitrophota bacterium]
MSSAWFFEEKNKIGILSFDKPGTEVNVLTTEHLTEFSVWIDKIAGQTGLEALVIRSAKSRIFIAGADINEIAGITTEKDAFEKAEQGKAVLQKLENLKFPTVCVINGACLGGGYELALACTFRVASFSDQVKIGLPEANLGILPGFGGSIRLPKLLGLTRALPMILAGRVVSAKDALKNGMVDRLFPAGSLDADAFAFAEQASKKKIKAGKKSKDTMTWFLENTPIGRAIVFGQARKGVALKAKNFYPAPYEIIKLIQKTVGKVSPLAYRLESEHFAKLGTTAVSKNLIKLFFMSEKYKKVAWTKSSVKTAPVEKCGVIGAGVMGGGIAQLVSAKNIPVRVKDINDKALGGALKEARKIYQGALKRKKITASELERKMHHISVGLTPEGLRRCQVIIEAVVEDLGIKQKVFKDLDERCAPETILASNTSSLPVTQMAAATKHPGRVIGLHFFNPVDRMPLVEVIRAEQTTDETVDRTVQFARLLGKTVIVVKDAPGFLVNRLLLPYMNEAAYLLEEGMGPEQIDRLVEGFGMPMGPVELADQVGIDVGVKVA